MHMKMGQPRALSALFLILAVACAPCHGQSEICIVGSGIGGASVAYFLREYAREAGQISVFEETGKVGGHMAVVEVEGDMF